MTCTTAAPTPTNTATALLPRPQSLVPPSQLPPLPPAPPLPHHQFPSPVPSPSSSVPPTPAPSPTPPPLNYLGTVLDEVTADFTASGGIVSLYIQDLATGETLTRDPAIAFAGTSLVKIPILVEAYRVMDGEPNDYHTQLITETTALSGNYTANLLLALVSGSDDPYRGSDVVTENLRRLGLYNTFIAAPYDSIPRPGRPTTYVTPANTRLDINTRPDPNMQTTADDLGHLLGWLYTCANGRPTPLDSYAEGVTADDCTAVLQMMTLNVIESSSRRVCPLACPSPISTAGLGIRMGMRPLYLPRNGRMSLSSFCTAPNGWNGGKAHRSSPKYPASPTPTSPTQRGRTQPILLPRPRSNPRPPPRLLAPCAIVTNTVGYWPTPGALPLTGAEIAILPGKGSVVELLDSEPGPNPLDGTAWGVVRSALGEEGWVGEAYLLLGD